MADDIVDYNLLSDCLRFPTDKEIDRLEAPQTLSDRDYFKLAINHNYNEIAQRYNCGCNMSAARLGDAHDYWQEDASRTFEQGIQASKNLDHFKHASFIAFWLRRTNPINETFDDRPVPVDERRNNTLFKRYGNEISALHIGYQICQFYERSRIAGKTGAEPNSVAMSLIRDTYIPPELMQDFAMILKHKSMSPYAIYLLYKGLFNTPRPSPQSRP